MLITPLTLTGISTTDILRGIMALFTKQTTEQTSIIKGVKLGQYRNGRGPTEHNASNEMRASSNISQWWC